MSWPVRQKDGRKGTSESRKPEEKMERKEEPTVNSFWAICEITPGHTIQHHTPSPDLKPAGGEEERLASQQLEATLQQS